MKRQMPISLWAAEAAIALLVVYLAVILVLDIRYILSGKSGTVPTAVTLLHLAWSITALIGIPSGYRPAWRLACAISAFTGALAVLAAGVFLFLLMLGHNDCIYPTIWYLFMALFFFVVYRCLKQPTAVNYFGTVVVQDVLDLRVMTAGMVDDGSGRKREEDKDGARG